METPNPQPSEGLDTRKLIGWIVIAVILGEAVWNLIVSVMNNLIVPWLGAVMGASSGLPTSFIQKPYDYPALFVSVLESCIAGMVAAILNYFLQRKKVRRVRTQKIVAPIPRVEPERVIPRTAVEEVRSQAPPAVVSPVAPSAPVENPEPVALTLPVPLAPPVQVPVVASAPVVTPTVVPAALGPLEPVAKSTAAPPQPQATKTEPPKPVPSKPESVKPVPSKPEPVKPKKSKPVYYNIVGEPMPDDE